MKLPGELPALQWTLYGRRSLAVLLLGLFLIRAGGTAEPSRAWRPWHLFQRSRAPSAPTHELPPKQAAAACAAAAKQLEQRGHRREAILLYERARSLDASQAQVCRSLAVLYDLEGAHAEAWREYQRALKLWPRDPDLWNDVGYYHDLRQNLVEAERCYRKALALAPSHPRAAVNLGTLAARQGRWAEAYDLFAGVLGPAAAHANVGLVMAREGHTADATVALRRALALDPTLTPAAAMLQHIERQASFASTPQP